MRATRELESGVVWVNDHLPFLSEMPHGGFKESGYGKDCPYTPVQEYTEIKHVMVRHGQREERCECQQERRRGSAARRARAPVAAFQSHGLLRLRRGDPDHRQRPMAATSPTQHGKAPTSTRSPACSAVQIGYGHGEEIGQAALEQMQRAALLHRLGLRSPPRDRARQARSPSSPAVSAAGVLHFRRIGGGRHPPGRWPASTTRCAASAAGRQSRATSLPRHDDGSAVDQRRARTA